MRGRRTQELAAIAIEVGEEVIVVAIGRLHSQPEILDVGVTAVTFFGLFFEIFEFTGPLVRAVLEFLIRHQE